MMRKNLLGVRILGMIGLFFVLVIASAHAEEASSARVSGLLFGDYYWMANHNATSTEGQNGFWIRRAQLTVDNDLSEQFSARLQLEMTQNDFATSSALTTPFIKNAYLKYNHSRHNIFLGISPTPTWNLVETHWGYRSIEKTPLDLQGFGSGSDGGIAFSGHFDQEKQWGYQLMIGNGAGTRSETNKDKKYYLALSNEPTKQVVFQWYGDYENGPSSATSTAVSTLQGFVGFKGVSGRVGILYAQRNTQQDGKADQKIDLASLYGVAKVKENVALIARVDVLLDPNPKADKISYLPMVKDAKSTLYLLGADFKVAEKVNIQPNVEMVTYSGDNGSDLIPRVTIFYKF